MLCAKHSRAEADFQRFGTMPVLESHKSMGALGFAREEGLRET